MDYTTVAGVKAALHAEKAVDDALLATQVTQASRAIDRIVTSREDCNDYFKLETVTAEILASSKNPLIDNQSRLVCWPHKPIVTALTALAYRQGGPRQAWVNTDVLDAEFANGKSICVWLTFSRVETQVRISYTGGLSATTAALPADLVELATMLATRFYKESQSGMGDAMGIAELGTITYSRAFPARFAETIEKYKRTQPW